MKNNLLLLVFTTGLILAPGLLFASAIDECKKHFDNAEYEEALPPCLKAGKSGHQDSQSILGEIYDRKGNARQTYYWWNRAAQDGYIPARNQLAMKFYYGGSIFGPDKGWQQDYRKAYAIWIEDARNGHAPAQFMVAEMNHQGQGVKQNYAEAWAWFSLSLEQGYQLAGDSLQELSRKMSAEQKQLGLKKLAEYRERIKRNKAEI